MNLSGEEIKLTYISQGGKAGIAHKSRCIRFPLADDITDLRGPRKIEEAKEGEEE